MVKKTKSIVQAFSVQDAKKVMFGEVVSVKMDKTAVVKVTRTVKHSLLGKMVKRFKKYQVHDEKNECGVGDVVEIAETRPLSKLKHMALKRIVEKAS